MSRVAKKKRTHAHEAAASTDKWLWPRFLSTGKFVVPDTPSLPHKVPANAPESRGGLMPEEKGLCMFCKILPIDILPPGAEIPVAEYHFNNNEEKLEKENGPYRCDLYFLIQDLYTAWSEGRRTPMRPRHGHTCHRGELGSGARRHVCIDNYDSYLFWTEYGAFVHSDPLGAPAITRILRWIDNCDDKHAKCLDKYAPVMPTRVLDVGNSKASGTIHLLETKGKTGDYIALSHCWGKPGPFLTTRDTLEDMKAGFQLEQAPATFRDAITITRKLGIRYLWIDSLCIIQGDAEDWEIEASRMADVYRNAYLTIAASNASSDDEGFLKPRRAACSSLKVFSPLGRSAQVYLTHENTDSGEWIYNSDAFRGPLTTRGWTLQEAYLSKRKLKFLEHEILWDCQECKREEHKSSDIGNLYASNDESVEVLLPLRREDFLPVYRGWYTMVEEYSTRHLSFHADRLPALSGLASLTAMPWDGIYLAGIWWEDAVYGICWRRKNPSLIKSDCYISPSWSWASVIGPVTFPGQSGSNSDLLPLSLVSFKEHYMGHGGLDKFGRVDSGWIRIEGPLTPFSLMTASDDKHIRDMKWFIVSGIPGSKADATVLFDFEIEEAENLRLLFLLRNRWDSDALSHRDEETLFGIVVKSEKNLSQDLGENIPSDVSNDQIYKRVGFFLIENARYVKDLNLEQRVTDIVLI